MCSKVFLNYVINVGVSGFKLPAKEPRFLGAKAAMASSAATFAGESSFQLLPVAQRFQRIALFFPSARVG